MFAKCVPERATVLQITAVLRSHVANCVHEKTLCFKSCPHITAFASVHHEFGVFFGFSWGGHCGLPQFVSKPNKTCFRKKGLRKRECAMPARTCRSKRPPRSMPTIGRAVGRHILSPEAHRGEFWGGDVQKFQTLKHSNMSKIQTLPTLRLSLGRCPGEFGASFVSALPLTVQLLRQHR